jgi:subtilisin family serine protease
MFGAASGTSQASPSVTAAAAYLLDEDAGWGRTPGAVKARLIETADWFDTLDGD